MRQVRSTSQRSTGPEAGESLIRVIRDAPIRESNLHARREVDTKTKTMILGLIISAVLLFIR